MYKRQGDDDWLVVTSSGLFDGTPGAWSQLAWRFSDSTFDLAPIEVFFREFFRPGLLHDLLAGRDVEPPSPIAAIDRRQPQVILKSTVDLATPQIVPQVQLEVQVSESRVPAPNLPHGSGARDLRLFRNGTLIKVWRGDLPLDMNGFASFSITVPIVAGENTFTAYAFSQANIKSPDATLTATGADTLQRLGTAYVLAIGINTYDADSSKQPMNLNFAENDARDFEDAFAASQNALHQFASVQTISLLSRQATRENILAALRILGGASTDSVTPAQRSLLRNIAAVRPEDGVFLFYAGHGAMEGEHFYLLPTDVDPSVPLTSAGFHAISEIELGQALENIAPKRSFLIIDACHSGAAIDVKNVGPMNSVGPVSYTHLDVYKRQLVIRAGEMAWSSSGAASPDGQWFVTQSYDGTLTVRSAEDGKEFRSFRPFGQQQAMVYPHRLAITADSKTIVFGSFNQIFLVDVDVYKRQGMR